MAKIKLNWQRVCLSVLLWMFFIFPYAQAQRKSSGEPNNWSTAQPARERVPPTPLGQIDHSYDVFAKKRKRIRKIQERYAQQQRQREIAQPLIYDTEDRHSKDARKRKNPPSEMGDPFLKKRKEEVRRSAEEWAIYQRDKEMMERSWRELVKNEFRKTQNTAPLEYDAGRESIAIAASYEGDMIVDLNKNRRMAFETASFGRDYVIKRRLQLVRRSSAYKIASARKHYQPYQPLEFGIFFKTEKPTVKGKPNYQRKKVKYRYDKKEAEMWRKLEENQKSSTRSPNGGFTTSKPVNTTNNNNPTQLQEDQQTLEEEEATSEEEENNQETEQEEDDED